MEVFKEATLRGGGSGSGTGESDRPPKKSWSELRGVVRDFRRRLSGVSDASVPDDVTFRSLPDGRTRIYFLGTLNNGWETTLLYVDVARSDQANGYRLHWLPVVEANFQGVSGVNRLSREEQLLWERKRLTTWGITSYELHPESGKLVFPAASSLYQCVDTGYAPGPLFPSELRISTPGAKLCPQICPWNDALVAYTCSGDLYLSHGVTGSSVRLTHARKGGKSLSEDPLTAGSPSYVTQEEFTRYVGYWWQPRSNDGAYRIVYEEVDESDVKIFCFPSASTSSLNTGEVDEFRFPRAGTCNAKSNLKMVQFRTSDAHRIVDIEILELQYPLYTMFPWMEYLVRVGWTPDARYVWVQLLDRKQQRLELVLLSVENFCEPPPNVYNSENHFGPSSANVRVLYSERSSVWINVHDLLYFLPSDDPTRVKFIWGSEETKFMHLYLITSSIAGLSNGVEEEPLDRLDSAYLEPRVISKTAITQGEWQVLRRKLWLDEANSIVYFVGLREGPLEQHAYAVSLRRPLEIRLLTRPGSSYNNVYFNKDCTMLVTVHSSIKTSPSCQVFRITQTDRSVEGILLTALGYLVEPTVPESELFAPSIYAHKIASGDIVYSMIFKPHNFQRSVKYPTVLQIYGGPDVQLVTNTFKGMRHFRLHMLAAEGYCVVLIDSRGSKNRGLAFESHLRKRMGTVELSDQVEVLRLLAEKTGYIDMSRVALHGWSYGGYLSLMGIIHYPEVFKIAIAGAPVTCWNLYDTGYTERYMDLPQDNCAGYVNGSVLTYVNKFPDDANRLLIIHGLIDENVHFFHTSELINALIKTGKPYQLQVYPTERHSLRNLDATRHYETTLLSFLQNNL